MHDPNQCSSYVSFTVVHSGNMLMRAGKNMENLRQKWVFMDAWGLHARLELLTELPEKLDQWSHEKFTGPRAMSVLRKIESDMESGVLMGAMLIKEFLT